MLRHYLMLGAISLKVIFPRCYCAEILSARLAIDFYASTASSKDNASKPCRLRPHSQLYSHPFLNPDTGPFRLLEILDKNSGSGREGHKRTVISRLRTFASPRSSWTPKYAAISYTWGNPFPEGEDESGVKDWDTPSQYILCNEERFYIRQNLYDGLQELVRRAMFGFYWIDFICINQQDLLERNAQVAIMGEIFGSASEVICWLGRAEYCLEEAVELHERFSLVEERFGGVREARSSPEQIDRACTGVGIEAYGCKQTQSLYESCFVFWGRTWFKRLCLAQEVALANDLIVLFGQRRLNLQDMVLVAEHARSATYNVSWTRFFGKSTIQGSKVRRLERNRQHQEQDTRESDLLYMSGLERNQVRNACLLEVLGMTWQLLATDPRDKIYGVLGLVLKALTGKERPIKPIHVDYGLRALYSIRHGTHRRFTLSFSAGIRNQRIGRS
jgi:hypothetical protein